MRTPSRVEYHAYLGELVRTKQAKTMRKLIRAYIESNELGHEDHLHPVTIINIENQNEVCVLMNPSFSDDIIDERLAKGKAKAEA